MVVSKSAVSEVLSVIEKYVRKDKIGDLLEDLTEVSGNQSYQDAIGLLRTQYKRENP